MIKFKGILNNESLDVIHGTLGMKLHSLILQRGTMSISDRFPLVAHKRFAIAFSDSTKHRYIIFDARNFQPHPSIWEQCGLKIQIIDAPHKPLREKMLWPAQRLDSSFGTSITNFHKDAVLKQFTAYGNKFEGTFTICFPDFTVEDLEEASLKGTEKVEVNSIELVELIFTNNTKLFIILRAQGFEIEINSGKELNEIKEAYFDKRYNLQLQHSINEPESVN